MRVKSAIVRLDDERFDRLYSWQSSQSLFPIASFIGARCHAFRVGGFLFIRGSDLYAT